MGDPDVRWSDLLAAFGEDAGVLPDGIIVGSGRRDWPAVLNALAEAGWVTQWGSDHTGVERADLRRCRRSRESFAVWPAPGVRVNFFPDFEVLFDIDLRELIDQRAVDAVCALMRVIGAATGKDVTISSEGDFDDVVVRFDSTHKRIALAARRT